MTGSSEAGLHTLIQDNIPEKNPLSNDVFQKANCVKFDCKTSLFQISLMDLEITLEGKVSKDCFYFSSLM